jgi:UDP-galactopyranose mutase
VANKATVINRVAVHLLLKQITQFGTFCFKEIRPMDLIVFSHLRWGFVFQRPQHLLTRLSSTRRIIFIEEPIPGSAASPHWEIEKPQENIVICRLHTPGNTHGFSDEQLDWLQPAMKELLDDLECEESPDVWFYTPMAISLLEVLRPRLVIYDCMDELTAFKNAPLALREKERLLLERADLVFTGGPSLYRAKKDRHPHVHCFPSSVDAKHFSSCVDRAIAEPQDQVSIPRPRLGYYGVIDERIDLELLRQLAEARPDWQIVMVGPVVKIDPADLPRAANIHYLGQKKYEELPQYVDGWDVCLMPFALNDSTKFISPTKTLEYMAAEKLIVSTPITDVAEPYADTVFIAPDPEAFIAACDEALQLPQAEREQILARMKSILAKTSWDHTAKKMADLMQVTARTEMTEPATPSASVSKRAVVLGAGPTGLSAAYHLGEDALLLEKNSTVGGLCRSIVRDGYTFDFAGHIMFSNDAYVNELYQTLLGDNVHWQNREAWIYSQGVHTRYPFQGALYGLPVQTIKECILGAIEARYGVAAKPEQAPAPVSANGNGHASTNGKNGHSNHPLEITQSSSKNSIPQILNGRQSLNALPASRLTPTACDLSGDVKDCCADGVLESTARLAKPASNGKAKPEPQNFEEFIYQVWGRGIAKHFAIPYNQKLWAVPLSEMETSWLGGRVPLPDLGEMIEGALSPVGKPMGPNARFGYPLRGGFQALMDGFLPHLRGELKLETALVGFSPRRRELQLSNGSSVNYETLISTMPLPVLIKLAGEEAPSEIQAAAQALRYLSVRCVNLGIGREKLTEKHWIYYPEDTIFHRIFVQGNASPHNNPAGGFGLTCEITYHEHYKPLLLTGDALIERCVQDCQRVGMIDAQDTIQTGFEVDIPHAYVIYDHQRLQNVKLIRAWLKEYDVILAGRYSEWEYYNSDHAFIAGKKAAAEAKEMLAARAKPVMVMQ